MRIRTILSVGSAALVALALAAPAQAATTCAGQRATIVRGVGNDTIRGTRGRDVIVAGAGDDKIFAGGGNDLVCAGPDRDYLAGQRGNDRLFGGLDWRDVDDFDGTARLWGDYLTGGPGNDRLVPVFDAREGLRLERDQLVWRTSSNRVRVHLARGRATGQGRDSFPPARVSVVGSDFADVIVGSSRDDSVFASAGGDLVHGRAGHDFIWVDGGSRVGAADTVYAGDGHDDVYAFGGSDLVHSGPGNDYISTGSRKGPDRVFAGSGRDSVELSIANGPNQTYSGGPGANDAAVVSDRAANPREVSAAASFNLATGSLTYRFGAHRIGLPATGFEHLNMGLGSTFQVAAWQIRGTDEDNHVDARSTAGTRFAALAGDDRFLGSEFEDWYDGGARTDTGEALGANDTCIDVEEHSPDACTGSPPQ